MTWLGWCLVLSSARVFPPLRDMVDHSWRRTKKRPWVWSHSHAYTLSHHIHIYSHTYTDAHARFNVPSSPQPHWRLFGDLLLEVKEELVVRQGRLCSVLDHVLHKAGFQLALVPDDMQGGEEWPLISQPTNESSGSLRLCSVQFREQIQIIRHGSVVWNS